MGRRQGRPLEVIPRHVEDGFLESERERSDSGVLGTKGIVVFVKLGGFVRCGVAVVGVVLVVYRTFSQYFLLPSKI